MNVAEIRLRNRRRIEAYGYTFNPNLPLLDRVEILRSSRDVVGRILSVYACVACSYGFRKDAAIQWLKREEIEGDLSPKENLFLYEQDASTQAHVQWQVESLWALTWAASYHDEFDFVVPCSDRFVRLFPDLTRGDSSAQFGQQCRLRSLEEIMSASDLAYCLHWALRENLRVGRSAGRISLRLLEERRRGLEWLTCGEGWDDISLDT